MSARILRMAENANSRTPGENARIETTLLDLVSAVADAAESDEEVVAAISSILNSGQVMLVGNFRAESLGEKLD